VRYASLHAPYGLCVIGGATLVDKIVLVGAGIVVFVGLVLARNAGEAHWYCPTTVLLIK